jgi:hypothetical protein
MTNEQQALDIGRVVAHRWQDSCSQGAAMVGVLYRPVWLTAMVVLQ